MAWEISDSSNEQMTFSDIFDSQSQLLIYHFVFGQNWKKAALVLP